MKILYDEHDIIVKAIDIANHSKSLIGKDDLQYESIVRSLIKFFRLYADQYHHHKEEEILFPELAKKNELLAEGVLKEMFDHHEDFREMIRGIEHFLNEKKYTDAQLQLKLYTEALLDHIAVENEEVFQIAEDLLDETELEKIYFRFSDCDRELGEERKEELVRLLQETQPN